MTKHINIKFLSDPEQYDLSEKHWVALWNQIDPHHRESFGWRQPWFQPLPPNVSQGNPIFSAYSPILQRGIRIIQHEPTAPKLEIQAWLDTFGGDLTDPDHIHELVISCALSELASMNASSLMATWLRGDAISFEKLGSDLLPRDGRGPRQVIRFSVLAA